MGSGGIDSSVNYSTTVAVQSAAKRAESFQTGKKAGMRHLDMTKREK